MKAAELAKLLAAIIVCQLAGAIGSVFTFQSIPTWYASLQKPFFTPPAWLFAPAWLTLYTLMGIALFLVWGKGLGERRTKTAVSFFALQLALNALWSIVFFGFKLPFYAFVEIIFLWAAILATMVKFYPISKKAAFLMLPYLAWVSFAALLNLFVWLLNA